MEGNQPTEAHSRPGDGTCQNTERKRPDVGHSLPADGRGRGMSGHGKKPTDRGPLTLWGRQWNGFVRTQKQTDWAKGTHVLETAEGGTYQNTERNRLSKAHSLPGDGRGKELSGTEANRPSKVHSRPADGRVRTRGENDRERHTHILKTGEGGTCQDTERKRSSEGHSLSGDSRGKDLLGHEMKKTGRGTLTLWRRQREGRVRTLKQTDRARYTHVLEVAERRTPQDAERNRPSKAHSHTGDCRERDLSGRIKKPTERGALTSWRQQRDLSGHRKKLTERGALTSWRWQREGLVRTQKETDRARRTHILEMVERGTCHDTERYRSSEAHSLPGDGGRRDLSGHRKE